MKRPNILTQIGNSMRCTILLVLACLCGHSNAYAAHSGTDIFSATVDGLVYHISAYWWYDTDNYETHYNGSATVIGINNGNNFTTEVKIPPMITVPNRPYVYPVISLSEYLFRNDTYLETFILENTNVGIGDYSFENCGNLTNINLGEGVKYIKSHAFRNCTAIETIDIPPTEYISDNAFMGCTDLKTIHLSHLKYLGEKTFEGCTSLTDVEIGGFTTDETDTPPTYQIGKQAFTGCTALRNVVLRCTEVPSCERTAFDADTYANATLYVPEGTLQAYRDDRVWSRFRHIVEGDQSAIVDIEAPAADGLCDVYSLSGSLLRESVPADAWKQGLAPGVYIVRSADGKVEKRIVR